MKLDYYRVLGVERSCSGEELKKAFFKLALQWHPDRHVGGDAKQAETQFKLINEAYETLADKSKRSVYDDSRGSTSASSSARSSSGRTRSSPFRSYGMKNQTRANTSASPAGTDTVGRRRHSVRMTPRQAVMYGTIAGAVCTVLYCTSEVIDSLWTHKNRTKLFANMRSEALTPEDGP